MRPARDARMQTLWLCPQGHVLHRSGAGAPNFCDACHPDFDWSKLQDHVPVDECRQLYTD